ncbi:unnamed protein product [Gadus morhua 'NCC']
MPAGGGDPGAHRPGGGIDWEPAKEHAINRTSNSSAHPEALLLEQAHHVKSLITLSSASPHHQPPTLVPHTPTPTLLSYLITPTTRPPPPHPITTRIPPPYPITTPPLLHTKPTTLPPPHPMNMSFHSIPAPSNHHLPPPLTD